MTLLDIQALGCETEPKLRPNTQSAKHDRANGDSAKRPLDHRHANHLSLSVLNFRLAKAYREKGNRVRSISLTNKIPKKIVQAVTHRFRILAPTEAHYRASRLHL